MDWKTIIIAAIIGIGLTVVVEHVIIPLFKRPKLLSNNGVWKAAKELYSQIDKGKGNREKFSPDLIVGIDGGGSIFASYLARLNESRIPIFELQIDRSNKDNPQADPPAFFAELLRGKKILLIDDVAPTGKTLLSAKKAMESVCIDCLIKVAVVAKPNPLKVRPTLKGILVYDYFVYEHNGTHTIELPWEVWV